MRFCLGFFLSRYLLAIWNTSPHLAEPCSAPLRRFLPAGGHRKGDHPVPKGKEKQALGGIFVQWMEKGLFMAAESFPNRSTRFIPSFQHPAVSKAAHQTMGKGSSHTHHGFFCVVMESKNILPFRENKKAPGNQGRRFPRVPGVRTLIYWIDTLLYLVPASFVRACSISLLFQCTGR